MHCARTTSAAEQLGDGPISALLKIHISLTQKRKLKLRKLSGTETFISGKRFHLDYEAPC